MDVRLRGQNETKLEARPLNLNRLAHLFHSPHPLPQAIIEYLLCTMDVKTVFLRNEGQIYHIDSMALAEKWTSLY